MSPLVKTCIKFQVECFTPSQLFNSVIPQTYQFATHKMWEKKLENGLLKMRLTIHEMGTERDSARQRHKNKLERYNINIYLFTLPYNINKEFKIKCSTQKLINN